MSLLVTLSCAARPADGGTRDGTGWSLIRADLDVYVSFEQITVEARLRLRLDKIETSYGPTLSLNTGRGAIMQFDEVRSEGSAQIEWNIEDSNYPTRRLTHIRFDEALAQGAELEVRIRSSSIDEINQFSIAEDIVLASWVVSWYPIPIRTTNEGLGERGRAPGSMQMHLPPGWRSVTNGALVHRDEQENRVVETWEIPQAVSRSFTAGPYTSVAQHQVGNRKVGVYMLSADIEKAETQAQALVQSMEAMEAHFGPYPYPSTLIAEVPSWIPGFFAASEQGFIMAKPGTFTQGGNIPLFAHEAAHGWWGNRIGTTRGPGAIFLNESLAQYSMVLALEAVRGRDAAIAFMNTGQGGFTPFHNAKGYFAIIIKQGHDTPIMSIRRGNGFNHHIANSKGMWIYHMLRYRVGDAVFFDTMRSLVKAHMDSVWSVQNLEDAFIAAAPHAEVSTFFDQWLNRAGVPIVEAEWSASETGGTDLVIRQVQDDAPYHLQLEIEIETTEGATQRYTFDMRSRQISHTLPGTIKSVRLDPDYHLLLWRPEYGPKPE